MAELRECCTNDGSLTCVEEECIKFGIYRRREYIFIVVERMYTVLLNGWSGKFIGGGLAGLVG